MLVVLGLPHLVLTDVGDGDGAAARQLEQVADDLGAEQLALGHGRMLGRVGGTDDLPQLGVGAPFGDPVEPGVVRPALDAVHELPQHFAEVADDADVDPHVLVDLGGIDVDVDLA